MLVPEKLERNKVSFKADDLIGKVQAAFAILDILDVPVIVGLNIEIDYGFINVGQILWHLHVLGESDLNLAKLAYTLDIAFERTILRLDKDRYHLLLGPNKRGSHKVC